MNIYQAMSRLEYLSYDIKTENGERLVVIEKDTLFEVLERLKETIVNSDDQKSESLKLAGKLANSAKAVINSSAKNISINIVKMQEHLNDYDNRILNG